MLLVALPLIFFANMKKSNMCPHKDSDITFHPVRHFGSHSCSAPLYRKLSVTLIILLMSLSHAQSQHSVTRTKNPYPVPTPHQSSTRNSTHNSAGSRTRPANAGTRTPRGLTSHTQGSSTKHCGLQHSLLVFSH